MGESKKSNIAVRILKIAGKTLLALVIVAGVLLFCAVKFVNSKYLTEMVEDIANDNIDGILSVGEIKLGLRAGYPMLSLEVKDISVISHAFDSLSVEERGQLPVYADSLLSLDYMSGSLNVKRLLMDNELDLHDVELRGLAGNLVIARNGKASYDIVRIPPDTAKTKKSKLPGIRIDKFAITQPKEMRFYNAADSLAASVLLLTDAAVDGEGQPTYRLKINGNLRSPKATVMTNLDKISFGINGRVFWTPERPGLVAIDDMELRGAFLKAMVSGEIDFENDPIVKRASVELEPVALNDVLTMLPDSVRDLHRLRAPYFSTDLAIGGRFELTEPMDLATDTLPSARINITIPPATLSYGKARFKEIALEATVTTAANQPDSAVVDIRRCVVEGPATRLEAMAEISTPFSDPSFTADMRGEIDLGNLPPFVREKIPGYISGIIATDLRARGRASVFTPQHIHRLMADGSVTARDIYFLAADTCSLVEVGNAKIDFDTKRIIGDTPVLSVKLAVDTATVLTGGIDLLFGSLKVGAGVDGKSVSATKDDGTMPPVSADLNVGRFNIITVTDTAGARIRDIAGNVRLTMRKSPVPDILADIKIGSASAGTVSDRIIINHAGITASLNKLPVVSKPKKKAAGTDTREREYTYISPAAVHRYVYRKRHHKRHIKRVYGEVGADDEEVLVWNLTTQFRGFLNDWRLRGRLNTDDGRLLMPQFPIRNRISALDISFSNDTVLISNLTMLAGSSDLTLSGRISNVKRALTSNTDNNLKANLSLLSNSIDVNELSATVFTGASYAHDKKKGKAGKARGGDDASLAAMVDALSKKGPGRSSPVLIPVNLDAKVRVEAKRMYYGDLNLQNMGCDLLVYEGGVNLHKMTAASDAGTMSLSALYSAPKITDMQLGFGMELKDFDVAKFVKLVPAIDSITPLMHDFSGLIGADLAATCRIDPGMNIDLSSLNAAVRICGDNLAFIDPEKYRKLGKLLGFKDKADNTIHSLNVEMSVADGLLRVYPFAFNIDRYRLGVYGYNDIAMNFDYHLSVLKSPLPFKFGITIKGNPKKYKVRLGGAKFNEQTAIDSVSIVNNARINLVDQMQNIFKRGVSNSKFAKLQIAYPKGYDDPADPGLTAADSLRLIREGIIDAPPAPETPAPEPAAKKTKKRKRFLFF